MTARSTSAFSGFFPVPADGDVWQWATVGALGFEIGMPGSGFIETVPDGFVTDLASIPRWLQWLVNPFDPQTAEGAAVHDWLLKRGFEQRVAAGEFYRRLRIAGVPRWKAIGYYLAVLAASTKW